MSTPVYLVSCIDATVVGFRVECDDDVLPKLWLCSQPDCPIIVRMEGLRVVKSGFVTCLRCLRPMVIIDATVH